MSAARTERLLNLLTLLLNTRRPLSLREIREHDEFRAYRTQDPKSGERAFERDKSALIELGVPLGWIPSEQYDDEEGIGGYLIDRKRYYLPEIELDPTQLALLSIAGAAAAAIDGFPGRATVVRALAKLGFDVDEARASRTLAHAPIREGKDQARIGACLKVLHDAVARRRTVRMSYRAAHGAGSERDVDPYGLYYRQGVWYLVGHCHLRDSERTFHLGRIQDVQLARSERHVAEYDVPDSFDVSEHARRRPWEFPSEEPFDVVIRLAERLVPAIPEIFGRAARLERTAAGPTVRLRVSHRAALISAVLPYGANAELLEPADLRREIGAIYEQLERRYGSAKKRRQREPAVARAS